VCVCVCVCVCACVCVAVVFVEQSVFSKYDKRLILCVCVCVCELKCVYKCSSVSVPSTALLRGPPNTAQSKSDAGNPDPAHLFCHGVSSVIRGSVVTVWVQDPSQSCVEKCLLALGTGHRPLLPQATQGLTQVLGLQGATLAKRLHHIQG